MACHLTQELTCHRFMSCWKKTTVWSAPKAAQRRSTNSCEHVSLPNLFRKCMWALRKLWWYKCLQNAVPVGPWHCSCAPEPLIESGLGMPFSAFIYRYYTYELFLFTFESDIFWFIFLVWICSLGWPGTQSDSLAWISQVLGLQVCTVCPGSRVTSMHHVPRF